MKTKLITALLLIGGATASQFASAADGTITFTGTVSPQTCTINGNGSGSNNFTITLPTVSVSSLATAGQTAARTPFSISLTACTPSSGNVHAYFEPGPTVDTSTGNLVLATGSGAATKVEIGLLNNDFTAINAGAADASQNSKSVAISSSGAATLSYYAQYVSLGTATAGSASSNVMYTLVYQ